MSSMSWSSMRLSPTQLSNAELLTRMNSVINYPVLALSSISRKQTKTHMEALIPRSLPVLHRMAHSLCSLYLKAACQVAICYKMGRQRLPRLLMQAIFSWLMDHWTQADTNSHADESLYFVLPDIWNFLGKTHKPQQNFYVASLPSFLQ